MKIAKFIICLLFGLMFINAGLNKFFYYMPEPEMGEQMIKVNAAFMTISWLMPLVAIIEILGGLLFIFPKTRALGALIIFPVLVGIVCHNIIFMPSGIPIALTFFLINILIILDNRKKYLPLVA